MSVTSAALAVLMTAVSSMYAMDRAAAASPQSTPPDAPAPTPDPAEEPAEPQDPPAGRDQKASRDESPSGTSRPSVQEPTSRASIERARAWDRSRAAGLDWLRRHQDADGKWDADEFMKHDRDGVVSDGPGNPVHDVGVTALALLAFLRDGSTPEHGPHVDTVDRAVRFLFAQQDEATGLIGTNASISFIYDHAIATLALATAHGLEPSAKLGLHAQRAIDYLESHRNPYAAWRYQPRDADNDTSVTGWCVQAYVAADAAGLNVNRPALQLALSWFEQMTDPVTARTGYVERGGRSSRNVGDHRERFPPQRGESMTAMSLLCRSDIAGGPAGDALARPQQDLLLKFPPEWNVENGAIDHYYWYLGTAALARLGGPGFERWRAQVTHAVLPHQRDDGNFRGSWDPIGVWGQVGGRVYSTAILCLAMDAVRK